MAGRIEALMIQRIKRKKNDNNDIERYNLRFFTILSLRHKLSSTHAYVARAQLCVNLVQHKGCLLRVRCHVPCGMKGQLSY